MNAATLSRISLVALTPWHDLGWLAYGGPTRGLHGGLPVFSGTPNGASLSYMVGRGRVLLGLSRLAGRPNRLDGAGAGWNRACWRCGGS